MGSDGRESAIGRGRLGGVLLLLLLFPSTALGQTDPAEDPAAELQNCFDSLGLPDTRDGRPIESPAVGPYYGLRLMGMGGAFTGVAEGIEAVPYTLTALANRRPQQGGWFDWDATATWLLPLKSMDVDYNGCPTNNGVTLWAAGGLLRFGRIGVGVFLDNLVFPSLAEGRISLTVWRPTSGVAWALPGDDFVVGIGLHTLYYDLKTANLTAQTFALGAGANVLWRPKGKRWRLGASFRLPQAAEVVDEIGAVVAGLPGAFVEPWQFTIGGAWWIGEGQLNQRIPHREGDAGNPPAIDGLLLTADVVMILPRKFEGRDAGGLEAFFEGRTQVVNPRPTLSLRIGTETEPIADRVRLRGGLWVEASRFVDITPRVHVTGGIDVRLFNLYGQDIRGSFALDYATGFVRDGIDPEEVTTYKVLSLSLGFW